MSFALANAGAAYPAKPLDSESVRYFVPPPALRPNIPAGVRV